MKLKDVSVMYAPNGNVEVSMSDWIEIIYDRVHLEHILRQENAAAVLMAVEAVKELRAKEEA